MGEDMSWGGPGEYSAGEGSEMGLEAVAQRGLYGVAGARDKETLSFGATGVRGSTSTTLGGGHVLVNEKPANDYGQRQLSKETRGR